MYEVFFEVELEIRGPVLSQSAVAGGFGLDAVMNKCASTDEYRLPSSHIRGQLKHALRDLLDTAGEENGIGLDEDLLKRLFGLPSGSMNGKYEQSAAPQRRELSVSDFTAKGQQDGTLTRIAMDNDLGAAKKGALIVIEAPFKPGSKVRFKGTINYLAMDETEEKQIEKSVRAGFGWLTGVGAYKTVGFGDVARVNIKRKEEQKSNYAVNVVVVETIPEVFQIEIHPDMPFCVTGRQGTSNMFESMENIPGGVIKGALAEHWARGSGHMTGGIKEGVDSARPELCREFHKVRFTHAFMVGNSESKRPVVPPLSLAVGKSDQIMDMADEAVDGRGFIFSPDWKSATRSNIHKMYGWAEPEYELQVRTQINADTGAADEGNLFSYKSVSIDGYKWLGSVDLSRVDGAIRQKVAAQLRSLLAGGIRGFGKTKANARINCGATPHEHSLKSTIVDYGGVWKVTLQTPTLICNWSGLSESSGYEELKAAYANAWSELSGYSLVLNDYFARQNLYGGYYIWKKFMGGNGYRPYLLTEPGSVFILKAADEQKAKAKEKLEGWLMYGLESPKWAKGLGLDSWEKCPYIPENGYGEIAVNLTHKDIKHA